MGLSINKVESRLESRREGRHQLPEKPLRRTVTLPPSNGRNVGSIFTNPVAPPIDDRIDIHDHAELARIVANAKAKGLVSGGETPKRAVVARAGVATGLASAVQGVESKWVEVDATQAAYWLKNNFRNRPLRLDTVSAYARDMVAGRWTKTHQGIAFNDEDDLIDGQHRLHAVVVASERMPGLKVAMMVTYGLPSKIEGAEMTTMDAVDRGATRSVPDQLKIQHGLKHGSAVAMICKILAVICCPERIKRLSVGETLDIYRMWQASIDAVIDGRSKAHGLRTAGVLAAFAFALPVEPSAAAMYQALVSGVGLSGAMCELRTFLTSDAAALLMRGSDRALSTVVLAVIDADVNGRAVPDIAALVDASEGAARYRALNGARAAKVAAMFGRGL